MVHLMRFATKSSEPLYFVDVLANAARIHGITATHFYQPRTPPTSSDSVGHALKQGSVLRPT
jgi:hypothetical protein